MPLTHINDQGRARMVDVSEKAITHRIAVAAGSIYMQPETLQAIIDGQIKKGDVLAVAQVAGIMAAKVLKGKDPATYPVKTITQGDMVVNLKQAQLLGIQLPDSMIKAAETKGEVIK